MRILILGAGGMLGHKLWQRLPSRFPDTWATLRARADHYGACDLFNGPRVIDRLDALDFPSLRKVLDDLRPTAILSCIGITKRRDGDPLPSIELNAALPHRLADWTRANGARIVHFSTDCVFDGRTGGYGEESPPNAVDLYGRTKALGEIAGPGALTLRTSLIGREIAGRTELLEWFLRQRGRTIQGFRRAIFTGISTLRMCDLVADILERFPDLHGLLQPAAAAISKHDLLGLARDAFAIPVTIEPHDDVQVLRNLDGSRFRAATGLAIPDWRTMMAELAADPTPYDAWSAPHAA